MDKKTKIVLIVAGILIVIAVLVAFFVSGDSNALTSDEVLRINSTVYSKQEFIEYIKYLLYKNDGEFSIDKDAHATDIENGISEEDIFKEDALQSFYEQKIYEVVAEKENITLTDDEIAGITEEFNNNKDAILNTGISEESYTKFEKDQLIVDKITGNPSEYLDLPDGVYDNYVASLSGDELKSYSYRIMQVAYTADSTSGEGSGEYVVSGDRAEKEAYMNFLVERLKNGESFEVVAESGDNRIIAVDGGYSFGKSALEHSAGVFLEQKLGMFIGGDTQLSDAIKQTPSGELTEVVDTGNSFQIALVEGVTEGFDEQAKNEVIQTLISSLYQDIISTYVKDVELNNSVVSRINIK